MVKGISRQVIVVESPDRKMFEQAIFILSDSALRDGGITDEKLLKEAKQLMGQASADKKKRLRYYGLIWACAGALVTAIAWILTSVL